MLKKFTQFINRLILSPEASVNLGELLVKEKEEIKSRRNANGFSTKLNEDSIGIALSGGGIRSSTLCLGILKSLNEIDFLRKTDYLSSVSGGGYIACFIHAYLHVHQHDLNKYETVFSDSNIQHFRDSRQHLYVLPQYKWLSRMIIVITFILAFLFNWFWLIIPVILFVRFDISGIILFVIAALLSILISPNFTSLHSYYKYSLSKVYLWFNRKIKLSTLAKSTGPYPLINATIHVNQDDYDSSNIVSYRGKINSNYFLYSPLYIVIQVTKFVNSDKHTFKNTTLARAMTTSGAALSTFMGYEHKSFLLRWLLVLLNVRTGILSPNPLLKYNSPALWPYYTAKEILGKANTTTARVQVSDGGHIENLAIYELLRRKVKLIFAIDAGHDPNFEFRDLKNLIVRAQNELGAIISFDEANNPSTVIKPNLINGNSTNHFCIATISGIKGSYAAGYDGILVYIKSSILHKKEFKLRKLKRQIQQIDTKADVEESLKRELNKVMYRTYTPDFPHQSTTKQFFTSEQWDAYYELGESIGDVLKDNFNFDKNDSKSELNNKVKLRF